MGDPLLEAVLKNQETLGRNSAALQRLESGHSEMRTDLKLQNGRLGKVETAVTTIKGIKSGVVLAGSLLGSGITLAIGAVALWLRWRN